MKIKFLLFTFLLVSLSFAQTKGTIKGTLTDMANKHNIQVPLSIPLLCFRLTTVLWGI
jgi:hypothetical protein